MAPAGSGLGGGHWADNPPTGAPVSVVAQINEESGIITVSWVNGDLDAWTQIGRSEDPGVEPTSTLFLAAPRETNWETGLSDLGYYWVRHTKGGTPSDWVGPASI